MSDKPTYEELEQRVKELERVESELRLSENKFHQKAHDLGERIKELNCLYSISNLIETPDISLEEIVYRYSD